GGQPAVEGDREPELAAPGPDGVVVVGTVEAESVEPVGVAWPLTGDGLPPGLGDGPDDAVRQPGHVDAQSAAMLKFVDRLGGRVHRDHAGDSQTVPPRFDGVRSEEHTSELQSLTNLVCRLLL